MECINVHMYMYSSGHIIIQLYTCACKVYDTCMLIHVCILKQAIKWLVEYRDQMKYMYIDKEQYMYMYMHGVYTSSHLL